MSHISREDLARELSVAHATGLLYGDLLARWLNATAADRERAADLAHLCARLTEFAARTSATDGDIRVAASDMARFVEGAATLRDGLTRLDPRALRHSLLTQYAEALDANARIGLDLLAQGPPR